MNVRPATARALAFRGAFTPATEIFLWSRVAIWVAALLALAWFPAHRHLTFGTGLWVRWDAGWFVRIAHHGYGSDPVDAPAFFPLYPGLMAILGRAFGGRFALAGLLISLASCLVAFRLLWHLAAERLGTRVATRAVLYLAVFPMALFLQAVYSESLYLALVLAAFAFARRDRWPPAALAAGLALLTRSSGIAVVAALAVLAWPSVRRLLLLAAVPLAIFSLFPLALWLQAKDPWLFLHRQANWGRHLSPAGPFGGIWDAFARVAHRPESSSLHHAIAVNLEGIGFLALFLALLPFVWTRLGAAYGVFATLSVALPLSFPSTSYALLSLPRLGLVVFPFYLVLATLGERPRAHAAIVAVSSLLLGVAVVQWATFAWVS